MADKDLLFNTLDDGTGDGVPLAKVLEGDAAAAKNASAGLVAKDSSGNLIYLTLNASGQLPVTLESGGTDCIGGHLAKTAGSMARTQVGADFALTAGKALSNLEWAFSNYRSTDYEVVVVDDPAGTPVETPVLDVLCGSGSTNADGKQICMDDIDTTGMTAPVLRVYGTNLTATSDFRARITVQQAP